MEPISGRDVSDFVLEFWILNFELFLLHFILESCNPQETADDEEEDLSMNSKSIVSTTKSQVSKLKRRGHPWPP